MSANTLEADTGNNCMYPKVLSLYETVISICIYLKLSSLYESVTYAMQSVTQTGTYIPEGIITVRDSDLCHVMIQTGSMSSTQTGPRYL